MEIRINKADRTLNVNVDELSPAVMEYVVRYGLTQILNDAHSTINSKENGAAEKAMAMAEKKLSALLTGDIRVAGTRTSDPVRKVAMDSARAIITDAAKRAKREMTAAEVTKLAGDYLVKHPELTEAAKRTVAAREAAMDDAMALLG